MVQTSISGIFQSDILIRAALNEGFKELRAAPFLLDYAFAFLPKDELTANAYGQKEVDEAKKWFLATEIPVFFNLWTAEVRFPCVTIVLGNSNEMENTLSDVHYDPFEDNQEFWPDLTIPFTPIAYNPFTGKLTLPPSINGNALSTDQSIVTRNGHIYPILEVPDASTLMIAQNINDDLNNIVIRGNRAAMSTQLEGAAFAETYVIGCHINSVTNHLIYLHSIVLFILLRHRQDLLEGRGFERSFLRSLDPTRDEKFVPEGIFSRFIYLSGMVRHFWPKKITHKINTVISQPKIIDAGHLVPNNPHAILEAPFVGDQDKDSLDVLAGLTLTKPIPIII